MEPHTVLRPGKRALGSPDGRGWMDDRIAREWRREFTNVPNANGSEGGE